MKPYKGADAERNERVSSPIFLTNIGPAWP
jgi:hypothetical protein